MWGNMQDMMGQFFSTQNSSQDSSKNANSWPFGNNQRPPEIPAWISQWMSSSPLMGSHQGNDQDTQPNQGQMQWPFGNLEHMASQWPFSTMQNNPFSMFLGQQNAQGSSSAGSKSRSTGNGPSSRYRSRRRIRPF